ncbi:hypothetical protein AMJ85_03285 [candidate division BRC1 bacterium SM23_51]|nr:MAG: hypothetical protein AMJ85_03285 [candidate division BRC1 bacterium SM23_51]
MILGEKLSELAQSGKGRYLLVNVVMRRSRELYAGAKPLVKTPSGSDVGTIAYQEMVNDRVRVTRRKAPPRLVDLAEQNR